MLTGLKIAFWIWRDARPVPPATAILTIVLCNGICWRRSSSILLYFIDFDFFWFFRNRDLKNPMALMVILFICMVTPLYIIRDYRNPSSQYPSGRVVEVIFHVVMRDSTLMRRVILTLRKSRTSEPDWNLCLSTNTPPTPKRNIIL